MQPHRISVRSVTQSRRTSRDAACTMVIGRDTANMGPTCVRASGVTCSQAVISWLPANSNHQHVVCVNNVEVYIKHFIIKRFAELLRNCCEDKLVFHN